MQMLMLGCAALAGVIHVLFFCMESLWWTKPAIRKTFKQTEQDAETTKMLAYNQGFYNLFLAAGNAVGIALVMVGNPQVGLVVLANNCGIMLGAALILLISSPKMIRGVVLQGLPPLVYLAGFIYQTWLL